MNKQIRSLYRIAGQSSRRILGLMSGTSLDGLDIALCNVTGNGRDTILQLEAFQTVPYTETFRAEVLSVFAKRHIDQQVLCGLHAQIGVMHGQMTCAALSEWGIKTEDVDLIASHGQTVYHAPQSLTGHHRYPNSTLQIGDGDHVARYTGIITVSDFRQKHVAAGGEGAPLALYGDYLLYSHEAENRILLNIGGISNFSFLPRIGEKQVAFATDIGPGNTLMNQFMQATCGKEMDERGGLARQGEVHESLLKALLEHCFFQKHFPKTTGPELFNLDYLYDAQKRSETIGLSVADTMATLNEFTVRCIVEAVQQLELSEVAVYISGGGVHNDELMRRITMQFGNVKSYPFERLGLSVDAKEAALFAVLANETVAGNIDNIKELLHVPQVCMGKISLPD